MTFGLKLGIFRRNKWDFGKFWLIITVSTVTPKCYGQRMTNVYKNLAKNVQNANFSAFFEA